MKYCTAASASISGLQKSKNVLTAKKILEQVKLHASFQISSMTANSDVILLAAEQFLPTRTQQHTFLCINGLDSVTLIVGTKT